MSAVVVVDVGVVVEVLVDGRAAVDGLDGAAVVSAVVDGAAGVDVEAGGRRRVVGGGAVVEGTVVVDEVDVELVAPGREVPGADVATAAPVRRPRAG